MHHGPRLFLDLNRQSRFGVDTGDIGTGTVAVCYGILLRISMMLKCRHQFAIGILVVSGAAKGGGERKTTGVGAGTGGGCLRGGYLII